MSRLTSPNRLVSLAVLSALVVLAGCGGSSGSSSSSGGGYGGGGSSSAAKTTKSTTSATSGGAAATSSGGGQTVKLAAAASGLKFDATSLTAKAGKVTVAMTNPQGSGIPHGIAVQGNGVDKDGKIVQAGSVSTVQLTLKPGKYTFYCPVPGHRAAGMVGTLTVK